MDASLLHLYWPLRDCDQPYWATGQPSSMRPRFLVHATVLILDGPTNWPNKSSSWTMYVSGSCGLTFEPRIADICLIRMPRYYGQLSSGPGQSCYILTRLIRTPVNADKGYFFSTPINKFLDRRKLTSIIWHNQLCAVLILASDEVILGCQHFDVYRATVDGIRWSGDVNFWLFKVL